MTRKDFPEDYPRAEDYARIIKDITNVIAQNCLSYYETEIVLDCLKRRLSEQIVQFPES